MKFKSFNIIPNNKGEFINELADCNFYLNYNKTLKNYYIVSINVFINATDENDFLQKILTVKNILLKYSTVKITPNFISQKPMINGNIAFEIHAVSKNDIEIEYIRYKYIIYPRITFSNGSKMIFVSGIQSKYDKTISTKNISEPFDIAEEILISEKLNFNNIIRQWNYIENILEVNNDKTNYQVFNDVRSDYFNKVEFNNNYPSATGIGIKFGGFLLSFYAVSNDFNTISIDNKLQTPAYDYNIINTPKFVRGKYIDCMGDDIIFVSGTASIKNQETIGDNIIDQITITNENIDYLISENNLKEHNINKKYHIGYERIYIKDEKYFNPIQGHIKNHNNLVVVGDICRDNLLIEIEAYTL